MQALMDTYVEENEAFEAGNKKAGTRARQALQAIIEAAKERRKEIQKKKNA